MAFYFTYVNLIFALSIIKNILPDKIVVLNIGKKIKVSLLWSTVIISLVIILGFRGIFTVDSYVYEIGFRIINASETITYHYNFLYDWINRFTYLIGGNIHTVFFISSVITLYFVNKGVKNIEYDRYLYITLFLLTFQYFDLFNIVRQGISMSIFFYASKFIHEKNAKKYFWFSLLAILFHYSAIIMLPLYFIGRRKIPYSIMLSSLLLAYFGGGWLANSSLLERLFGSLWHESYIKQFDYALITVSEVIIAMVILFFKDRLISNEKDNMYINFTWLFALFRISAANLFILHRFSKYFIYFYIISLLMSTKLFKDRRIKLLVLTIVFLFYELWFFFYMRGYKTYHPYSIMDFFAVFPMN